MNIRWQLCCVYSDRSLGKKKARKMKALFIKLKFQPTGIPDLHVSWGHNSTLKGIFYILILDLS